MMFKSLNSEFMEQGPDLVRLTACAILAAASLLAAGDTRLPDAAMQGDGTTVHNLLQHKTDVNTAQGDGMTALHWAASKDDVDMARALIQAGANLKATTRIDHITPLFGAARTGSVSMIDLLVKAGADVNAVNTAGTTPLMLASASGNAAAVKLLIDHGAAVNAKESTWGETALMFAAALNRAEVVRVLTEHGADVNSTAKVARLDQTIPLLAEEGQRRPQDAAAASKKDEKASADTTTAPEGAKPAAGETQRAQGGGRRRGVSTMGGFTALHFAAREGYMEAIQTLVAAGANVNQLSPADKMSAMTEAIVNGHFDVGRYLLDHGADPKLTTDDGISALLATVDSQWVNKAWYPQPSVDQEKTNYLDLMKDLLDHGADPNQQGTNYIWFRKGHDVSDQSGATAFWRAAEANDIAAMKLLMKYGANPNLVVKNGTTPLMVAAGLGYGHQSTMTVPDARLASLKYLVEECGANVNAKDNIGYTALHGAAFVGDNESILYLVSKGADVKARSNPGTGRDHFGGDGGGLNPKGDTVADYANGPSMNTLLFPDTVALLEKLGSENSHDCRSEACVLNVRPDKPAGDLKK